MEKDTTFREIASQIELTIFDGLIILATGQMVTSANNDDDDENSGNDDDPMFRIICYTQNPEGSVLLQMKRSVLLSECPMLLANPGKAEGRAASVRGLLYFEQERNMSETLLSVDVKSIQLSTNPVPIPIQLQERLGLQEKFPSSSSNFRSINDEKEVHQEEKVHQKEEEEVHQEEEVPQKEEVSQDGETTTENNQDFSENFITPQEEMPVTELDLNEDLSLVIEELEKFRDEEMTTETMINETPTVSVTAIHQQEVLNAAQVLAQEETNESMTRETQLSKQQEENTSASKSPADSVVEDEDRIVEEMSETETIQALIGESSVEEPYKDNNILPVQQSSVETQQQQKSLSLIEETGDKERSLVENVEPFQEIVSLTQEEELQQQMTGSASPVADNEVQVQQYPLEESFHSAENLVMQRAQDSTPYPQQEPIYINGNEDITSAKEVLVTIPLLTPPELPNISQAVQPSQPEEQQVMNGTQDERNEDHIRKRQKNVHSSIQQEKLSSVAPIEQQGPSKRGRGRGRKKQKERFIGPILLRRSPRLAKKKRPQYFPLSRRRIRKKNQDETSQKNIT